MNNKKLMFLTSKTSGYDAVIGKRIVAHISVHGSVVWSKYKVNPDAIARINSFASGVAHYYNSPDFISGYVS